MRKAMDSKFFKGFSFAIDRGGTFTDVFAKTPTGKPVVMKLLSEDPANYPDAPREGIRRMLEQVIIFLFILLCIHFDYHSFVY